MGKGIVILGSTGSIGTQTLDVVNKLNIPVKVLTAGKNVKLLFEQILQFKPAVVAVADESSADMLGAMLKEAKICNTEILYGEKGIETAAAYPDADCVITAIVGSAGIRPTLAAAKLGRRIGLANKETLVAAGRLVTDTCRKYGAEIIPVDSEHSAIFQCLRGEKTSEVAKLILTASGGPFRGYTFEQLKNVTLAQTLRHPSWVMGHKITVDSATMMNKGFEVIEASWLFDVPRSYIDVLVHPQSIVHSMVRFVDGACIAQLGVPDMRVPIQLALTYPQRAASPADVLELEKVGTLTFEKPDADVFRCLGLAYEAVTRGGTAPCVLNAANEVAVSMFLKETISFCDIPSIIYDTLSGMNVSDYSSADEIFAADADARSYAENIANKKYIRQ